MELNFNKINKLFEESKYSKRELAKKCGFTRPTLDGLLQGADVKISTLIALANFFGKPISYFFDEENKETYTATGSHGIVAKSIGSIDNRESVGISESIDKVKEIDIEDNLEELIIPNDDSHLARTIIERLSMEVKLLKDHLETTKNQLADKERFIAHLLNSKL